MIRIEKAMVDFDMPSNSVRLWISGVDIDSDGEKAVPVVVAPDLFEKSSRENVLRRPAAVLTEQAAQALMESLWLAGLRPAATRYASELVAAKEAHLGDMRRTLELSEKRVDVLIKAVVQDEQSLFASSLKPLDPKV